MGGSIFCRQVLLASSGAKYNEKGGFAKQFVRLPGDKSSNYTQKTPIAGVNMDILHFKEIQRQMKIWQKNGFQKNVQISFIAIESSSYKGKLLKRKEITSRLAEAFKTGHNTFIFTGHGYYEGAMVIQTQQNEEGQPFKIDELLKIFLQNRQKQSQLTIYLDCCYAGKMAIYLKLNQIPDDLSICIFCSSGPSQKSLDVNNFGGLLVCYLWATLLNNVYLTEDNIKYLAQTFQLNHPFVQSYRQSQSKQVESATTNKREWVTQPLFWPESRGNLQQMRQRKFDDCNCQLL